MDERRVRHADGPVALLAHDDLRDALHFFLVLLVDLFAEEEDDRVRILLERARVMADDSVREPRGRARHGEIEHLVDSGRSDGQEAVPAHDVCRWAKRHSIRREARAYRPGPEFELRRG